MSASAKTMAGTGNELIIAADANRDHITLQLHEAGPVYLAFDEDAADATGIALIYAGCSVKVTGAKARLAVYGHTDGTEVIGIETMSDVEYHPGSDVA